MNIPDRIERIEDIHTDCLVIIRRLQQNYADFEKSANTEGAPDVDAVKRSFSRLEQLQAAALRHTAILHNDASALVVAPQVGGGDKDDEYP